MIQNGDKARWAVASIFALAALAPGAVCAADPDAKTVLRLANELTQPFLEQVSEMVSIDSPTYYVPGIEKMEAVVRRRMAEFGEASPLRVIETQALSFQPRLQHSILRRKAIASCCSRCTQPHSIATMT